MNFTTIVVFIKILSFIRLKFSLKDLYSILNILNMLINLYYGKNNMVV